MFNFFCGKVRRGGDDFGGRLFIFEVFIFEGESKGVFRGELGL